ncbi:MAG: Sigma-70, region 4 [Armatimonadetes bacterium]|nr:Sigma-70, region 4 [Armatimonadota bacterium]
MATVMRPESEVARLVSENHSLVEWSVNRYLSRHHVQGIERDDLVSWGMMGLLSAARAFDAGRGLRFSTLASVAIERSILRGAMQAGNQNSGALSLDEALSESSAAEGETRWIETLRDDGAERQITRTEELQELGRAMDRLRPEQQRLIRLHFFQGYSLADLARQWGTTRQAVAGQLRRALRSMRRGLEPAWF